MTSPPSSRPDNERAGILQFVTSLPGIRRVVATVRASYRRKLAAALLLVLLITLVAAAGLYLQVSDILESDTEQSMTAATTAEAGELAEWLDRNRLITRVIAADTVYDTGDPGAIREYLRSQRQGWQGTRVVNAYIIERQNMTVEASAHQQLEGTAVADLPWKDRFAFRSFDTVRLTRPHENRNETMVVSFITPIRQAPGCLLVVTVDATSAFDRFNHPVDGGFTRVVDSNGTVVFADDPDTILSQYHEGRVRVPAVTDGLHGQTGFIKDPAYGDDSERYVAAYAPVDGSDWVLVKHAPASEAYAVSRQILTWTGAIGVLALSGLIAVVVVLGTDVTRALSRLTHRAEQIAGGDYDVDFETDRADEFGDLNRTLSTTRDTLRQRFEEIQDNERTLRERSAMVGVLNRVLRHNVRNDINVIAGRAELATELADRGDVQEELDTIHKTAMDLAALSNRTKRIQQLIVDDNVSTEAIELPERLAVALDGVRANCPDATISLHVPETGVPAVEVPETLPQALADVVEHLIGCNADDATVEVTVHTTGDGEWIVVTIDDDGGGLPELDVQSVEQGEETPLRHAKGVALWSLSWTVSETAGELNLDPDGTTLELRLPAAREQGE